MISRIDIRSAIKFCFKKHDSIDQCEEELHQAFGDAAYCRKTIKKYYEQFEKGDFSLEDDPRSGRPLITDRSQEIDTIISADPTKSIRLLSSETGLACDTIKRICTNDLHLARKSSVQVPHTLTQEQKKDRTELCTILLKELEPKAKYHYRNVITLDESWFEHSSSPESLWLDEDDDPLEVPSLSIGKKKLLVTIAFSGCEVWLVEALPDGMTMTADNFIHRILIPLQERIKSRYSSSSTNKWLLHFDNAAAHSSSAVSSFFSSTIFRKLPHPAYSPDLAPCDFFLFGHLKRQLKGLSFADNESLLAYIRKLCTELSVDTLSSVFDNWLERLSVVSRSDGDYFPF